MDPVNKILRLKKDKYSRNYERTERMMTPQEQKQFDESMDKMRFDVIGLTKKQREVQERKEAREEERAWKTDIRNPDNWMTPENMKPVKFKSSGTKYVPTPINPFNEKPSPFFQDMFDMLNKRQRKRR